MRPGWRDLRDSFASLLWGISKRFYYWAPFAFLDAFDIYERYFKQILPSDTATAVSTLPDPAFMILVGGLVWSGVLTYNELRTRPETALTPEVMLGTLQRITAQPPTLPTMTLGNPDWHITLPNEDDRHVNMLEIHIAVGMTATRNSVKTLRLDVGDVASIYPLDPPRGESALSRGRQGENVLDRTWLELPIQCGAYASEAGWVQFRLGHANMTLTTGLLRSTEIEVVAITADDQEVSKRLTPPPKEWLTR